MQYIRREYESRVAEFNQDRVSSIKIKSTPIDLFIINIHAPTENSEEDVKESFYDELARIYDNIPGNMVKIIIADANAKIGKEAYFVSTIGLESAHDLSNNNGGRLISFAVPRNMIIST